MALVLVCPRNSSSWDTIDCEAQQYQLRSSQTRKLALRKLRVAPCTTRTSQFRNLKTSDTVAWSTHVSPLAFFIGYRTSNSFTMQAALSERFLRVAPARSGVLVQATSAPQKSLAAPTSRRSMSAPFPLPKCDMHLSFLILIRVS